MRKRNIKKLIESMTKKKKKKPVQSSAVKDALIGRKHFSKNKLPKQIVSRFVFYFF